MILRRGTEQHRTDDNILFKTTRASDHSHRLAETRNRETRTEEEIKEGARESIEQTGKQRDSNGSEKLRPMRMHNHTTLA